MSFTEAQVREAMRLEREQCAMRDPWIDRTKNAFKAEMKLRGHTYKTLSRALANIGITESPESIANRISNGTFPAWRLLQYLTAMGTQHFQVHF